MTLIVSRVIELYDVTFFLPFATPANMLCKFLAFCSIRSAGLKDIS